MCGVITISVEPGDFVQGAVSRSWIPSEGGKLPFRLSGQPHAEGPTVALSGVPIDLFDGEIGALITAGILTYDSLKSPLGNLGPSDPKAFVYCDFAARSLSPHAFLILWVAPSEERTGPYPDVDEPIRRVGLYSCSSSDDRNCCDRSNEESNPEIFCGAGPHASLSDGWLLPNVSISAE